MFVLKEKKRAEKVCVCVKWLFFCSSGGERDEKGERERGEEKAKAIICTVCMYVCMRVSMKSPAAAIVFKNRLFIICLLLILDDICF
jgi:hypothetical protein